MPTQTLEFTYTPGQTLNASLVLAGTDTPAPNGGSVACVELPNRIDRYSATFTGASGSVQLILDIGGTPSAGDFYTLQDATNDTYYPWSEMPPAASSGTEDGGNYYALDNTVRDGLTVSTGWIPGDQLICEDPATPGTYVWLTGIRGRGREHQKAQRTSFIPSAVSDGTAYYAADTAALDVITNLGMKPGDSTILANVGIHVWKATYIGDFSGAVDGTEYDLSTMVALDGGSYYAVDNDARDQFFTDGLIAGDLVYNADAGSKGTYIMLTAYQGDFGLANPGQEYQFVSSPTVPPTAAVEQAVNPVAY